MAEISIWSGSSLAKSAQVQDAGCFLWLLTEVGLHARFDRWVRCRFCVANMVMFYKQSATLCTISSSKGMNGVSNRMWLDAAEIKSV